MANEERAAYLELRTGARSLLDTLGVPSNPAVGDEWIVNQLRSKASLSPIEGYEQRPESDFTLFESSLVQIVTELSGEMPEQDGRGAVLEARRLVHVLHGLFS